ncbi:MAG: DNA polymerase III subunit alpha, partial [Bacilli bacterium]|nr:DNA polymerase III subunit alpha [Bacilli bacterium]
MKKNPKQFVELQEEYYNNMKEKNLSEKLCHYTWDILISMNKGYGFNTAHTLGYSIVGLQEANLAYHYPIVYWNCANLISDSGGEDSTVRYGKIAAAIGKMRKEGIKVVLPDINRTRFGFRPDAKNNEIIYGLKAISGIGASIANAIVDNQSYTSFQDFYDKM